MKIWELGGGEVAQTGKAAACVRRCAMCLGVWCKALAAAVLTPKIGPSGAEDSFASYAL